MGIFPGTIGQVPSHEGMLWTMPGTHQEQRQYDDLMGSQDEWPGCTLAFVSTLDPFGIGPME